MKANKTVVAALALALSISMVACNNKDNTQANGGNTAGQQNGANTAAEQNAADNTNTANTANDQNVAGNDYVQQYSRFYGDNIGNLGTYRMYETPEATTEYYKTNKYPGNEKYVEELKAAYTDSRDKIQTFVDDLKNDAKTDDKKISDMNKQLIAEGEKTISNIDARLKNLDNLPKDAYNQSQDDFIRTVDETTRGKDEANSNFNNLLDEMNKALGITPNAQQNQGTMNNTNNNQNTNNNNNQNTNTNTKK